MDEILPANVVWEMPTDGTKAKNAAVNVFPINKTERWRVDLRIITLLNEIKKYLWFYLKSGRSQS